MDCNLITDETEGAASGTAFSDITDKLYSLISAPRSKP